MGIDVEKQDNIFKVGKNPLKNGWVLTIKDYGGQYNIDKVGVYGIWATRTTGGQWGDGIWTIRILESVGAEDTHINVDGGFTLDDCNSIINTMEAIMARYGINDYTIKKEKRESILTLIKHKLKELRYVSSTKN